MQELKNCPICQNDKFKPVYKAPYFRGKEEYFQIVECLQCELWFTNPRPEAGEELNSYYETEDYVSHTDSSQSLIDKVYLLVRNRALKSKLTLIERINEGTGSLLDYGAGTGAFVVAAHNNGWRASGVEPSEVARQQGETKGVQLYDPADRDALGKQRFDVITMWHVLEHLPELQDDFKYLADRLAEGGHLVIAVPNHESYDAQHYKSNWAALDIPLHLYHFKKDNLKTLAKQHGLKLRAIKNMPFDAFYVSMLSEKIASGKTNYLKAFWTGLKSNLKGGGSAKNMSSLIYILQKD